MHSWAGQSFSKMKTPGNIVKREYFYVCVRHVTFFLSVMRGWVWPSFGWVWPFIWVWVGVGECNQFLAGCGRLWPFVTFSWLGVGECGWVWPFSGWVLVGVGECAFFLAGCGWVWYFFDWVCVGVGKCGWVWVSARFITALSKLIWGIWQIFTRALESLKNMHFNGLHLTKVCNVSAKKAQRSYLSCHWRGMQNFDKNWLVVRKMTWRIWQIFTRALEILKVGTLMGSFCPK